MLTLYFITQYPVQQADVISLLNLLDTLSNSSSLLDRVELLEVGFLMLC